VRVGEIVTAKIERADEYNLHGSVAGFLEPTPPSSRGARLAMLRIACFGEPRRMGHKRLWPSFETPRKRAAPQDDGDRHCEEHLRRSNPVLRLWLWIASLSSGAHSRDPLARNDANIHIRSG
jgi:hypothetical protein